MTMVFDVGNLVVGLRRVVDLHGRAGRVRRADVAAARHSGVARFDPAIVRRQRLALPAAQR
jgi:hypothetical protein